MVKSIKLIPHWPFDARIYGDLHWQGCCWLEESHTNGAMHWQKPRMHSKWLKFLQIKVLEQAAPLKPTNFFQLK